MALMRDFDWKTALKASSGAAAAVLLEAQGCYEAVFHKESLGFKVRHGGL